MDNFIQAVKNFVEGRLGAESFFAELYKSEEMEKAFSAVTKLPQWASAESLYMYLIEGDPSDSIFTRNAKDLLGGFLTNNGVQFKPDKTYEILESAVPDWLDLTDDYFGEILSDDKLTVAQKKAAIKNKIKAEYKYLRRPPNWLQSPEWAVRDGKPLLFVGELAERDGAFTAMLYIFHDEKADDYVVVRQYD